MLRIITDFDGPIVDLSGRYYQVYQYCLQQAQSSSQQHQTINQLSYQQFWQLKRAKVSEIDIALKSGLNPAQAQVFVQIRQQNAHALANLKYDRLVPGATAALHQIKLHGDLVVMTMRRQQELDYAIAQFNLGDLLRRDRCYSISNNYVKRQDVLDKPLLVAAALAKLPPAESTWMIGDTEADIVSAKTFNIPVIAVLSGIRDRSRLAAYDPDYIVKDLPTAVELILSLTSSERHLAQKTTNQPKQDKSS